MHALPLPGLLLLLLPACGDKDPGGDDTGGGDDWKAPECDLAVSIEGPARARPGEPAAATVHMTGSHVDTAAVAWAASDGVLDDDAATTITWTPPADAATHRDETHTLTVSVTEHGCAPAVATLDVEVGWEDPDRVVTIYNPAVEGSEDVARAYGALHALPETAICPIETAADTVLDGADLPAFLEAVQDCVDQVGERVHYLVPVYGVPYKVSGVIDDISGSGAKATVSLDAMAVYGTAAATATAAIYNPLWQQGDSLAGVYDPWIPFGALRDGEDPYYLIARIDGADADAAIALVDRTAEAMALAADGALDGVVYVDGRYGDSAPTTDEFGSYESGEWNMWGTRTLFEDLGWYDVVWDGNSAEFGTDPAPTECPDALYYAGWYSYNNYNDAFVWAPGAIGGHLDSCSACDLRGGSAWAANALDAGITATFGAVNEPYVAGMPEYDQLFRYLTEGASYGEAAYQSTRVGLWMMVFVGDPLYRPYPAD